MLPVNRFKSFVELKQLFEPTGKILLAVSGGKDSVLMTHLFNEGKFTFGIAHCNFGLRDAESDGDQDFTESLAKQVKVPFFTTRFDTNSEAAKSKSSIQMIARQLRYDWFEKIRSEFNYDYIAIAHHQNDTVETILLNLVRGTGIAGLHGILPKREKIVRPLLFLNKEEIDELINLNNIDFREDSSNSSSKYARNKIRLDVIPVLKTLNPQLQETFERNASRFKELEDFLNHQTTLLRTQLFRVSQTGEPHIKIDDLKTLNPKHLLLFELFKPFNFSEAVLQDLALSWDNQPGKVFESPTHILFLDRDYLILKDNEIRDNLAILIGQDDEVCDWQGTRFMISSSDLRSFPPIATNDKVFLDPAMLQFPLKLRHWNKGDYFYPFGMKGKKKLSDFFISLKISLPEKDKIPVLENGNGEIIWIAGYRSDERYKITAATKKVIIFEKYKN